MDFCIKSGEKPQQPFWRVNGTISPCRSQACVSLVPAIPFAPILAVFSVFAGFQGVEDACAAPAHDFANAFAALDADHHGGVFTFACAVPVQTSAANLAFDSNDGDFHFLLFLVGGSCDEARQRRNPSVAEVDWNGMSPRRRGFPIQNALWKEGWKQLLRYAASRKIMQDEYFTGAT